MKLLKIIKDADMGSDALAPAKYERRVTSRGVLVDADKKIGLIHNPKKNFYMLPGGGVEAGESVEEAFIREMAEETGCKISDIIELGIVEEFRNVSAINQTSYCYLAKVLEKGVPELVGYEVDDGYIVKWIGLDELLTILQAEHKVYFESAKYDGKFMQLREEVMLAEARKYLIK